VAWAPPAQARSQWQSRGARPALPFSEQTSPPTPSGSSAIAPTRRGMPVFSLGDARNYVISRNPLHVARAGIAPIITRMQFLTSEQVSGLTGGESAGFPDSYMLCYVEMQGPFQFSGPNGVKAIYPRGVLVFDAATGNLVMAGGMQ
jgi:hypothetical protein